MNLKCRISGVIFPDSHPHLNYNGLIIYETGMDEIMHRWIELNSRNPGIPLCLHLIEKSLKRKVFNRYVSKKDRAYVMKKYANTCKFCGSTKKVEIDHIKPVSKGGTNDISNLQVLCKSCNIKKSDK